MFKTVELFSSDKVNLLRNLAVNVLKVFELKHAYKICNQLIGDVDCVYY